jgi:AAA+ lid domain
MHAKALLLNQCTKTVVRPFGQKQVFQGLLQGSAALITEKEQFIRLWAHECLRVFSDRLVDAPDRAWFDGMLGGMVKAHFNVDWNRYYCIYCYSIDTLLVYNVYVCWSLQCTCVCCTCGAHAVLHSGVTMRRRCT